MVGRGISALMVQLLLSAAACGATKYWDGGGGSMSWSVGANWNPDGVPGPNDDVVIDVPDNITVQYSASYTIRSLSLYNNLALIGGVLTVSEPSVLYGNTLINGTLGVLTSCTVNGTLDLNGSISGAGAILVNGTLNWSSAEPATISGSGALVIGRSGLLTKSGNAELRRDLEVQGTVTSSSRWFVGQGKQIVNLGVFTHSVNAGTTTANFLTGSQNALFLNHGVFKKTGNGSCYNQHSGSGQFVFENHGAFIIDEGEFNMAGGTHSGAFNVANQAALLRFQLHPCTITKVAQISGVGTLEINLDPRHAFECHGIVDLDGTLRIVEGSPHFHAPISVRNSLVIGSTDEPSATFHEAVSFGPSGQLLASSKYALFFNGPVNDLAGTISGSTSTIQFAKPAIVMRSLQWNGGWLQGDGGLLIEKSGLVTFGHVNPRVLMTPMHNYGTLMTGPSNITMHQPGTIINHSVMQITSANVTVIGGSSGYIGTVVNHGTLRKLGPGTVTFGSSSLPVEGNLENYSLLTIDEGALHTYGHLTNGGVIDVVRIATLEVFGTSTHAVNSALNIQGRLVFTPPPTINYVHDLIGVADITGELSISGGTLILHNGITPELPVSMVGRPIIQSDVNQYWPNGVTMHGSAGPNPPTITGSGTITLGGTSVFRGKMTGSGTTIVERGATLMIPPVSGAVTTPAIERTVVNEGITVIQFGTLNFRDGEFINDGICYVDHATSLQIRGTSGTSAIVNSGLIAKIGVGTATLLNLGGQLSLANNGVIAVEQGTLALNIESVGGGIFEVDADATFVLNSMVDAGAIENKGHIQIAPNVQLQLADVFMQTSSGTLKASMTLAEDPILICAIAELSGALELSLTPPPTLQVTVPVLQTTTSPIVGEFVSHVLHPHGNIVYSSQQLDWIVFRLGDANGDNVVNVDDLLLVISSWGNCPSPPGLCSADVNGSGAVNIEDLTIVINNWN